MRRTTAIAIGPALALAFTACGGGGSSSSSKPASSPNTVVLQNIQFQPSSTTVKVGDTVTWEWKDGGIPHNVVADDKSFDSGDAKTSGTYKFTFTRAGTFKYHCVVHSSMTGTVTVH